MTPVHPPTLHIVQAALRSHAFNNRGMLSPTQLAHIAAMLVPLFMDEPSPAPADFERLWSQGLGLESFTTAGKQLYAAVLDAGATPPEHIVDRLVTGSISYCAFERKLIQEEQAALQRAMQQAQAAQRSMDLLIQELSTPIVPIYDGVVVVPLTGTIDEQRAQRMSTTLLGEISSRQARFVIIDLTGVPVLDTMIAQHLLQMVQAATLLGTQVLLVGIRPEMAQTVVQLGITVGFIPTLRDLQAAILYVFQRLGLAICTLSRA